MGCEIHSADRVVAEWQHVEVGDEVKLHPDVSMAVAGLDEGRALVLRGAVPMGNAAAPYDCTWAFVLRDRPDGSTRPVMRERYGYTRRWAGLLIEPVEAVGFVMSRKMLMGVRDRAEAGCASNVAAQRDETTRTEVVLPGSPAVALLGDRIRRGWRVSGIGLAVAALGVTALVVRDAHARGDARQPGRRSRVPLPGGTA